MSEAAPRNDVDDEVLDPGRKHRQIAMVLVILTCVGAIAWALFPTRPAAGDGTCAPEGGLRCASSTASTEARLELCEGGTLVPSIACPGGCLDDGGGARCRTESGALAAPVGAGCQSGMSLCTHDATALLVCRDGRLARAAECPKGCVDQGDALGLFCLDATDGIRFAAGFPCPGFKAPADGVERACGPDEKGLLRCENGLLVPDPTVCTECAQSRTGDVTCVGENGEVLVSSAPPPEPLPVPEALPVPENLPVPETLPAADPTAEPEAPRAPAP
ncbi:MAG: hypothetical protein IV100_31055 [Myxococcales bacterium]|nr:hypothetical protein [Myxococcales bacterium]